MKKVRKKYEDWFVKESFSSMELALLMADTVPDRALAKAMIKAVDPRNAKAHRDFFEEFGVDQHSAYLEKFRRSLARVNSCLASGLGASRNSDSGKIPFSEAVAIVLDQNGVDGDFYWAFMRAALEALVRPQQTLLSNEPRWRTELNLEEIIKDKIESHKEKGLFYRGKPNKSLLAKELCAIINDNEIRKGRRRIGVQSVRNLLKNREL